MQVLAHRPAVREGRDEAVRQVPRVRRDEAQPRDGRPAVGAAQPVDRADQLSEVGPPVEVELAARPALGVDVREARLGRQVVAVAVDVLAEERDLAVAGGSQRPRLVDDLVERPAALGAAAERHDAVGARLVAAVDDRQPGADRRPAGDRALGDGSCPGSRQVVCDAHHASVPRPWSRRPRRSEPARRPVPAGRRARAPRPGAGTGRPPDSGGGARRDAARGPSTRSARRGGRGSPPSAVPGVPAGR